MQKIRKGDEVVVIAGKDKGKRGNVKTVAADGFVLVEGINLAQKHQKPNPVKGVAGGIVSMEKPLHISNVALFNPSTQKADRVGLLTLEDGRKVRIFKSNGSQVGA